ncbi:MAG TPA: glutathione S-transferase N-terminal domain-containing protein [Candidatus Binataceae bacterium]|nr:glutathione S-transferase N-terminal domain-containing protein [Candidatus Binataceae bacterium]
MPQLKLVGGYGSPYSRKMRAVLRYRRIGFRWIRRGSAEDVGIPAVPVALIPVLVFPGEDGASDEAMIDSTFQIKRLERMFAERSLLHPDPAMQFLQELIEDYADEWVTKAMFHYRWQYAPDVHKASHVLMLDRDVNLAGEQLERMARYIAERQIARLGVVGSNGTTKPVIEASYARTLHLIDNHLAAGFRFLMGSRPGVGDFGLFGQLSQLVHFDPTPVEIAERETPRIFSWVTHLDDLSWLEVDDAGWMRREQIPPTLRAFFTEIGRVYTPFLIANARALANKADRVECEIDGRPWVQQPFPYQGKCLMWLRESHAKLGPSDRDFVDSVLAGTGADMILAAKLGV